LLAYGYEELQNPSLAGKPRKLQGQRTSAHLVVTLSLAPGAQITGSTQPTAITPLAEGSKVTDFI